MWSVWLLFLTFMAVLAVVAVVVVARPWTVFNAGAVTYASSLTRSTKYGSLDEFAAFGTCEPIDRDRGIWSCAIVGDSEYLPYVLWESGDEGCWQAQPIVGESGPAGATLSGCASFLDALGGAADFEGTVRPLPDSVTENLPDAPVS